jgi:hypothetical protein
MKKSHMHGHDLNVRFFSFAPLSKHGVLHPFSLYTLPCSSQEHACQLRPSHCIEQSAIIRRIGAQKNRPKIAQEASSFDMLDVAQPEPVKANAAVSCIRSRRTTCEAQEGSSLASSSTLGTERMGKTDSHTMRAACQQSGMIRKRPHAKPAQWLRRGTHLSDSDAR